MVGGDGNDAGGSDGYDPCVHIPAVLTATTKVATEGRTAAESVDLEATALGGQYINNHNGQDGSCYCYTR